MLAGCTHTVTHYYLPSATNSRFTIDQAPGALTPWVKIRCAEQPPLANGTAALAVDIGDDGLATRAELTRSTNDRTLDGVFGAIAAQLSFPRPAAAADRVRAVTIHFTCAKDANELVKVDVR